MINKEDCVVGFRVAWQVEVEVEEYEILFGVIKKEFPFVEDHYGMGLQVEVEVEDNWTDLLGVEHIDHYDDKVCFKDLMTEAEGKEKQLAFETKAAVLEDEFTAIKKVVLEKSAAAALLIEEVNNLLAGNRKLTEVYAPEISKLEIAIACAGWCTSDHNC